LSLRNPPYSGIRRVSQSLNPPYTNRNPERTDPVKGNAQILDGLNAALTDSIKDDVESSTFL